jgi:uncharacterized protein YdaU (DUF1376 family)
MAGAPYPADTRAKGWRLELDHERIRQSDTWAITPAEIRPWLLMLWMVAWEQTPCGSLPNDDALVAARIGMKAKEFAKHKATLMRGWELCDDGRLYHHVLTLRVGEMLEKRRKDAARKGKQRGDGPDSTPSPTRVPRDSAVTDATSTSTRTSYSVPNGTGGKPPSAQDLVWAMGVPLLTAAGVREPNARSMLGKLAGTHGAEALALAIQRCAEEGAQVQPGQQATGP